MKKLYGYLAPEGLEETLAKELQEISYRYDRLFLSPQAPDQVHFAQNIWFEPAFEPISSISSGVKLLKSIQRNWALFPFQNVRRSKLIEEGLPPLSKKLQTFPSPLPNHPLGSFTLIDANTLLYSHKCSSLFPNGEISFQETKTPPSRAYLKLWEIFTLLQKMPQKNETCLEIGASPGSWTYVLAALKSKVYCIDKAPIVDSLLKLPNVHFQKGDAFSLKPENFPPIDWFFSDVICYPEKLYEFLTNWLPVCKNFVCTLKFQGTDHYHAIPLFKSIPGSHLYHLFNNKHELTWVKLDASIPDSHYL
ncbi:MAG: SAM-dependent methyltransferase [Chlamydiota bacterium]